MQFVFYVWFFWTFPSFLASSAGPAQLIAYKSCKDSGNHTITTSQECIDASSTLNLTYSGTKNVITSPKGCYIIKHHLSVFFNTNMDNIRYHNTEYEGHFPICNAGNEIIFSTHYLISGFYSYSLICVTRFATCCLFKFQGLPVNYLSQKLLSSLFLSLLYLLLLVLL